MDATKPAIGSTRCEKSEARNHLDGSLVYRLRILGQPGSKKVLQAITAIRPGMTG